MRIARIAALGVAALASSVAIAEESFIVIDSRPGVKEVLVLTPSSTAGAAEVRNIVIVLIGGNGQINAHRASGDAGKLTVSGGFPLAQRQQMADSVGMVAALSPPSDHRAMDVDWRDSPEHVKDIGAAIDTLHARYPAAKVWLLGHSNGAWSAARAGAALQDKVAGIVMMAGAEGAFATEGFAQIRIPVLVVHHRRDACLEYRPAAVGAAGHTLLTVDDARLRMPAMPGDCSGETGAHLFSGKETAVIAAVAEWINTGHAPERIN